ncbi:MAG: HlyD family secretion protein [Sphingobacterium sp.]|jgi:HlyD family secretion protein|uniref:HlyD family secretion protein n=1 Tax=Sphingobacterium sp. TaxID=341027 RepID=UPI00283B4BBE|nr:HlyD family efflux transporter periplasmic adaptor subunit [Sphingobacterium sp.]MDR3008602.1 HlyD family secretion protein [Sphingobacterium sp.]
MHQIKPSKLARNGTWLTASIILIFAFGSWFIKYPDTVNAKARLGGTAFPKPLVCPISGRISSINFQNGEQVKEGEIIASLESSANYHDVLLLSKFLDSLYFYLENNEMPQIKKFMQYKFQDLGELQPSYSNLVQAYIPFENYTFGNYTNNKKRLLGKDLNNNKESELILKKQEDLNKQDLELSNISIVKNNKLLEEKLISEEEYRKLVSLDLNKKSSQVQLQTGHLSNKGQANDIQKELLELENQEDNNRLLFKEAIGNMQSQIYEWKKNYLIIAKQGGTINYSSFYQTGQYLEQGVAIAYIIPPMQGIFLEAKVSQNNFGKISLGQVVIIKFDAYPWQQFGIVKGKVDFISAIPVDSGNYLARISLPNGLVSNYKKNLGFKEGLLANAEIITKDMRLPERLYYDFVKQIKK